MEGGGVHRRFTSQASSLVWQTHHICLPSVYSVYDLFLSDFMCLLSEEIAASGCYCLQNTDTF